MVRPSPWLPRMMPTTPVWPMPVTTSSQPKAFSLLGDEGGGLEDVEVQFGRLVQVAAPAGDLVLHFGGTVQDRHDWSISLLVQGLLRSLACNRDRQALCHVGVT